MICGGRRGGGQQRALTEAEAPPPGQGPPWPAAHPCCAHGEGSELESRQFRVKGPLCLSILAALPSLTPTSGCPLCLQNHPESDQLSHPMASALCGLHYLSPVSAQLPPGWSPRLHPAPLSILHTPAPPRHGMPPLPQNLPVTPAPYRGKARLLSAASWPCRSALATFGRLPEPPPLLASLQPHGEPPCSSSNSPSVLWPPGLCACFPGPRQLPPSSVHRLPPPLPQVPVQIPLGSSLGPWKGIAISVSAPHPPTLGLFFGAFSAI